MRKQNTNENQINKFKGIAIAIAMLIAIIALNFGVSKFILNREDETTLNFYEYRIATTEIVISPETYTGKEVTVEITADKPGLSVQYKLEGSDEWVDYTGPFSIDDNLTIETRYVSDEDSFEGPVTEKDVTNIAVAKIGDVYYKTLADAIAACPENAGNTQTKIEMLTNVTENVVIPEGKNVVLDLCGATVSSAAGTTEPTITVNGTFNLIDSAQNEDGTLQGNGKVESSIGAAIKVSETGEFTLGTNETTPNVDSTNPVIVGETYGVVVEENGEFNFYDGVISGKTNAINGTVTDKPENYDIAISEEGEYEVARLKTTITVTFDKNADNATVEFEIVTIISETALEKLPTAQREGYVFKGWYTEKENGEKVTLETIFNNTTTIYAQWEAHTYTITYNSNGGTGTTNSTNATYDAEATIPENTFTAPEGYTFKEWNTNADGTGTTYNPGDKVTNLTSTQNGAVEIYAIWEDTIAPTNTAPTGVGTTSSITVNCNQKDTGSGIDTSTIEYSIYKDGKWSDWQTSNVFDGLTTNTEYEVKTRAKDNAGNGPVESEVGKISTSKIENATIEIHEDNENGEVVTPSTSTEDDSNQINNDLYIEVTPAPTGTTTITVKDPNGNETEVTNGTNTVTDTYYVFVDKTPPTTDPTSTSTTNTIKVQANEKDDESGIDEVTYVLKDGDTIIATNTTGEFTGLEDGKDYTVEITVTDKAGNGATTTEVVSTEKLVPGSLAFTESTSGDTITPTNTDNNTVWTNENVNTTLTPGNAGTTTYEVIAPDGTKTTYTTDTQIPTTDGKYVVTVTTTDGTNTETVTYYFNVDKTLPTVSINPNGQEYTIAVGNTTANISSTLIAVDNENGSGINQTQYAWSESNTEEPTIWSNFVSGTPVSSTVEGGIYYLWTNVTDVAGNTATVVKTSQAFNVGYAVEFDANGGVGEIASQRKENEIDLTLTETQPTREGYLFKGWATTKDAAIAEYASKAIYTKDESVKLYAVWSEVVASTTINGVTTNYDSVQNAIDAAGTNSGAVVTLIKSEITETVTVAAGQDIVLDTNGKVLTSDGTTITNNGSLKVIGSGSVESTAAYVDNSEQAIYIVDNKGDFILDGARLSSESTGAIFNFTNGTVEVLDGTIDTYGVGIRNWGTSNTEEKPAVKISGGNIQTGQNSIINVSRGLVHITGGNITSENSLNRPTIINNGNGTIRVDGGTITAKTNQAIIAYNSNASETDGLIQINGGTINSESSAITSELGGTIEVTGGTIISNASNAIYTCNYSADIIISGDNTVIKGYTNGINSSASNITITGGTVQATAGVSIYNTGSGTVTIGDDSNSVSTENPEIIGSTAGVQIGSTGILNFYDGIIKAPEDETILGTVTATPTGYRVTNGTEEIEGTVYETAYLDNTYYVTLDDNCENGTTTVVDVVYNNKVGTLPAPTTTVTGYTFTGWFDEDGNQLTADTVITNDVTYYAQWTANTDTDYTVYHYRENANDTGYELVLTSNLEGTTDSTLTLANLTKAGEGELANCTVVKTTLTENGVSELTTTIAPDGSTKVYIYYSRNAYALVVSAGQNVNEATGSGTYKWGQTVNLTAEVESLAGYTYTNFVWKVTTSGINATDVIADTSNTTTTLTMPAATLQVSAVATRTANVYNLTYNLNNGSLIQGTTNPTTYTVEDEITLSAPTKEGYVFLGWQLTKLDGQTVENSPVITTIPAGTIGNREYTAVYNNGEVSYTVYHYLENANDNGYTIYNTQSVEAKTNDVIKLDENLAIAVPNATYAKSTTTLNGEQGTTITVAADSSSKIYVYYTRNTYELNVLAGANIGTIKINDEVGTEGTFKYGATVEINADLANLNGYTYSNFRWETTDTSILASTTAKTTTVTMPAGNTTITAVADRTINTYTITYTLDGGVVAGTNPETYTVESSNITLINPTKTGYTFTGWTGTGLSTPTKNVIISTGSYGNRTYTANWEINSYKVTYDYLTNGGNSATVSSAEFDYNTAIDLTPVATKDNYEFVGWNTDKNATTGLTTLTMGTENVTLYAIYAKDVTVTYDRNGGAADVENTYTMYNTNTSLEITMPLPTTFVGWTFKGYAQLNTATSGEAQGTVKTITVAENVTDVTYYHTWAKTVTFNANKPVNAEDSYNVTLNETSREVYYNNNFGTLPTNPTLAGWTFKGWYTSPTGGTQITANTLAQNVPTTVYAIWELSASISVTPENVTLDLSNNTTQKITVTGSNYGDVTYEVEDESVVTVDPATGVITAVGNGTTTITVTGSNGEVTDTITVTVVTTPTSVEISEDSATIGVVTNNTIQLNATVGPETSNEDNKVTWTSSNPGVATVDPQTGVVTGVSEGKTTITVTTENGCTDTCEIIVDATAPTVAVSIDNND